tara:strand:- start:704 stop:877 length:174 start_codon:yes stop_codon:yes gene_type:complete
MIYTAGCLINSHRPKSGQQILSKIRKKSGFLFCKHLKIDLYLQPQKRNIYLSNAGPD